MSQVIIEFLKVKRRTVDTVQSRYITHLQLIYFKKKQKLSRVVASVLVGLLLYVLSFTVVKEQQVNVKFLVTLSKSETETHSLLKQVYGDECLSRIQVLE